MVSVYHLITWTFFICTSYQNLSLQQNGKCLPKRKVSCILNCRFKAIKMHWIIFCTLLIKSFDKPEVVYKGCLNIHVQVSKSAKKRRLYLMNKQALGNGDMVMIVSMMTMIYQSLRPKWMKVNNEFSVPFPLSSRYMWFWWGQQRKPSVLYCNLNSCCIYAWYFLSLIPVFLYKVLLCLSTLILVHTCVFLCVLGSGCLSESQRE